MTIKYNGIGITLTQLPFIDGPMGERPLYKARGQDGSGNGYLVKWEVVENWQDIEDESDMVANWDAPNEVVFH
ncbi:hypothetical protein [Paenibacillus paeoniae]|uniref:Uncharacterized protein n=1 Tax=Paenibacillus paeoniae TaxID=2292705 RepID=A0A371P187_9BACL|nr:hypothetical protein [Paenibacillus paeoniae]REK69358.1 hypothetical protein DX130_24670 [Paenibacillus paeoniae]